VFYIQINIWEKWHLLGTRLRREWFGWRRGDYWEARWQLPAVMMKKGKAPRPNHFPTPSPRCGSRFRCSSCPLPMLPNLTALVPNQHFEYFERYVILYVNSPVYHHLFFYLLQFFILFLSTFKTTPFTNLFFRLFKQIKL